MVSNGWHRVCKDYLIYVQDGIVMRARVDGTDLNGVKFTREDVVPCYFHKGECKWVECMGKRAYPTFVGGFRKYRQTWRTYDVKPIGACYVGTVHGMEMARKYLTAKETKVYSLQN